MIRFRTWLWINRQRVLRGYRPIVKLRSGERYSPSNCPVAKSLGLPGVRVRTGRWSDDSGVVGRRVPSYVAEFISSFDTMKRYADLRI